MTKAQFIETGDKASALFGLTYIDVCRSMTTQDKGKYC